MMHNLKMRNLELRSYQTYPEPEDQQKRLLECGFEKAACWDMNQVYSKYLDESERSRIQKLEMFDEFEDVF